MPSTPLLTSVLLDAAPTVSPAFVLTASVAISAAGLAVLMQSSKRQLRIGGTVLGLAGFAMLFVEVLKRAAGPGSDGGLPPVFPVIFGFLAIAGAVRMITHPRPVFAALYFILVVIATGGTFLLLGAEFMAFALIIVYAGAILITYMFVLMLAQQSPSAGVNEAWYDRMPREAIASVVVGFVMLATLADAYFSPKAQQLRESTTTQSFQAGNEEAWKRLAAMPKLMLETVRKVEPSAVSVMADGEGAMKFVRDGGARVAVKCEDGSTKPVELGLQHLPDNGRQVGVDLVAKFPASLEIAAVVLLMALFGAVILARKQIELGEDERRGIAGMRRLTVDGEAGGFGGTR
jgi:NADH-quinone oxidoreductase subunit J